MCLDIEHALKIRILRDICCDKDEDGYEIVTESICKHPYIVQEIYKKRFSTYVGDLINNYFKFQIIDGEDGKSLVGICETTCPVWALMEIIGFGDFIKFYTFYYSEQQPYGVTDNILNLVKSLRNACAHNNCLIHNLRSGNSKPPYTISNFISKIKGISKDVRNKNLRRRPILEMTALLYIYEEVVVDTIKKHRLEELDDLLKNRMLKNRHYFKDQQIVKSTYYFFVKIVDFLK